MAGHDDTDSVVIGRGHNFLRNLKKIDDGLTSTDIQKLCFLCKDFDDVAWKELNRFKKGTELFSALKKAELLTEHDVSLLLELLEAIKRRDLIKKVKHFWPDASVRKSRLSTYRKLLLDISDNTTKSDLTDMKAMSDLPYSMDDNTNTIEFFNTLEAHGHISSDNVSYLNEILVNKLNQRKVQTYVKKHPQTTLHNQPSAGPSDYLSPGLMSNNPSDSYAQSIVSPSGLDLKPPEYYSLRNGHQQPAEGHGDGAATGLEKPFKELCVNKHDEELGHVDDNQVNLPVESEKQHAHEDGMMSAIGNQKLEELNRQDSRYDTNTSIASMTHKEQEELSQIGGENLPVVSHNASEPRDGNLPQSAGCEEDRKIVRNLGRCYRMTASVPGICLIINNDKFHAEPGGPKALKDRVGSEKDVEKLLNCFHKFNFDVIKMDNLTSYQMYDELNKVRASPNLLNHDAFVCCILTHGKIGQLAGSNSRYLKIQEIVSIFAAEKCQHLAGKPKMFFIQACLGKDEQSLQDIEMDCPRPKETGIGFGLKETVPNQSDFLLGFATVPGFVSYRSRTTGSWYIPALVDALNNNYLEEDLMSILTIVNDKLAHATAKTLKGERGQVPAPVTTLRKKVFFHRTEAVEYI